MNSNTATNLNCTRSSKQRTVLNAATRTAGSCKPFGSCAARLPHLPLTSRCRRVTAVSPARALKNLPSIPGQPAGPLPTSTARSDRAGSCAVSACNFSQWPESATCACRRLTPRSLPLLPLAAGAVLTMLTEMRLMNGPKATARAEQDSRAACCSACGSMRCK
jgi:hypothetical protein